ncbi:cytochrome P450 [Frankia sp. CNm7]|uniref:Cytochrome P450 n=1 Tax=Frankia nepalensis TaxID=1836974 RepID=A0A937UV50_9ACTN|nr:cytochrome P450 [Frankia nepalensis]MBL7514437.1 cytochrome P450 [Frankia nepalensis]MBL7524834.1 cytochrome P450 [Frankia nepalensis]MBL7632910.1 cytochrome P450 [Frankia nepalensis]
MPGGRGGGGEPAARAAELARRYPAHEGADRLYGDEFHRDPRRTYQRLRSRYGAVAPVLLDDDVPAWLVLGYRELHYVAGQPDLFSRDFRIWNAWDLAPADSPLHPRLAWTSTVISTDGAEHARYSTAVDDAVGAVDPFELAARCERIADRLINVFAGDGTADLISQYATQIPTAAGTTLLALPPAEAGPFSDDMNTLLAQGGTAAREVEARLRETVRAHAVARRVDPGADTLSQLATHPVALSDDEVFENLVMVFLMAQAKTAAWIGNTLRLMLTDPRFAVTLAGGRRSVAQALNDVLWEDPPSPNVLGRWATRAVQLGKAHVRRGDLVVLSVAAANTDPVVHPGPGAGAGARQAHLAFGSGAHRCPYPAQDIAEVVARTAVEVLLDRLPDVALALPADQLAWQSTVLLRHLTALPVVFTPA